MKSLLKMAIVATGVYFVFKYLDERKKGTDSTGAIKKAISDSQSDASLIVNDIKSAVQAPQLGTNSEYFSQMIVRDYVATPEATVAPAKTVIG